MKNKEKLEALRIINKDKQEFLKKYFEKKDVDIIAKNIINKISTEFSVINGLFFYAQYGFTQLTSSKDYWYMHPEQRKRLDLYHTSFLKINLHASVIFDEIYKISKCLKKTKS